MNEAMLNNMSTDELLHVFIDDEDPKLRLVATKLFQEKEVYMEDQAAENEGEISELTSKIEELEGKIDTLEDEKIDLKNELDELKKDAA